MVYTDGVHLTADSLDELYNYGNKMGLNPDWLHFMGRNLHPHFDIYGGVKQRVLEDANVKKVSCREIVRLCIKNFRVPETETHEIGADEPVAPTTVQLPSEEDYERMMDNIFKRSGIKRS